MGKSIDMNYKYFRLRLYFPDDSRAKSRAFLAGIIWELLFF